jgi:hypothetical protein
MAKVTINPTYYIIKNTDGSYETNLIDKDKVTKFVSTDMEYAAVKATYDLVKKVNSKTLTLEAVKSNLNSNFLLLGLSGAELDERYPIDKAVEQVTVGSVIKNINRTLGVEASRAFVDFFKETSYKPSYRMINTFLWSDNKAAFIRNYFEVKNSPDFGKICSLVESPELQQIVTKFAQAGITKPSTRINKRLTVYYGDAGTGKTTLGKSLTENTIVCNSSMLPVDLFRDFDFEQGQPKFGKSALWTAMELGKPILFDEINLLPFDTVRFLQGILDNKDYIDFMGQRIHIKEGFKIIGTMNLYLEDFGVCPLPGPLVDRCDCIKKFELSPEDLFEACI